MRRTRRLLLTTHIVLSTAGIGVAVATLVVAGLLPVGAPAAGSAELVHLLTVLAATVALGLVAGITTALSSPWGLFRHGWVVKKLGLNLVTVAGVGGVWLAVRSGAGLPVWVVELVVVAAVLKAVLSAALSVFKPGSRRPARSIPPRVTNAPRPPAVRLVPAVATSAQSDGRLLDHPVGIIGADGPGETIADQLLDHGFELAICAEQDVPDLLARRSGVSLAPIPADVTETAQVVLLMLGSEAAADEALFDLGGVGETLCDGGVVIDLSPTGVDTGRARSRRLARLGLIRLEGRLVGGTAVSPVGVRLSAGADVVAAHSIAPVLAALDVAAAA